ncbi:MAG: cytidylate kinase-like family protein [Lachnospiraceae bacterium]|nr:cytidylate kinase-like family protein [Lachnospiraceae bacterium]
MSKQLIISVSREFGSGGHIVAQHLAKKFELPLYNRNLLKEITIEKNWDLKELEKYDELSRKPLFSRTIRGYSNSPEENIANLQFEYLQKKADQGKSFVIVGRCAESVLKKYDALVSIFVLADVDTKIKRIMETHEISKLEAELMMKRYDRERKAYHNYYCVHKWGDSRNYDICVNSSRLGFECTANVLEEYIRERMERR